MTTKSSKQSARQQARSTSGQYRDMHKCELCGKALGSEYCSDRRVDTGNWGDTGICLCEKCCDKLDAMPDDEAYKLLRGGGR